MGSIYQIKKEKGQSKEKQFSNKLDMQIFEKKAKEQYGFVRSGEQVTGKGRYFVIYNDKKESSEDRSKRRFAESCKIGAF